MGQDRYSTDNSISAGSARSLLKRNPPHDHARRSSYYTDYMQNMKK